MPEISASDSLSQRRLMVDGQIRTFGITDLDLIDRFLAVPREMFVDSASVALAWSDAPLKLAGSPARTLLQPMVLAKMIQNASLKPGDRVLDIAGGLGYGAAVMAGMAAQVLALEEDEIYSASARQAIAALGLGNITTLTGDLATGASGHGPFDVILVNGAVQTGIAALLAQLSDGGRMLAIRNRPGQIIGEVVRYEKHGANTGERVLFETTAQVLHGFAATPAFAF